VTLEPTQAPALWDEPPDRDDGLRLHLSENTGGCSPRVIRALAGLRPADIASYPTYRSAIARCARHFGVEPEQIVMVNGLDEGILALAVLQLRLAGGSAAQAVILEPAFEVFKIAVTVAGGAIVPIAPGRDFACPVQDVLAAINDQTRLVLLASPNNPTGITVPAADVRAIARRLPAGAIMLVDEAYGEFANSTFLSSLGDCPNVVVGRSFSKAFGLAALRLGCLIGAPEVLEPLRLVRPIYSINGAAVVALRAALDDHAYVERYVREVAQSKALVYAACDRLGFRYWRSESNFVLVRVGEPAADFVAWSAARGIHVRDRSSLAGCAGCVRVTAGIVDHTRRFLEVLEAFAVSRPALGDGAPNPREPVAGRPR
jgi:histidinol-phosphate aminotransferase